jgi:5-methylcytosine-specific restriction enzyme A
MAKRASLSPMKRLKIFELHGGRCTFCEQPIQPGEPWEVSHDRPLELLGADDDTNRKPAHKTCHAVQTRTEDMPRIVKAKRQAAKHVGAIRPEGKLKSRGFPPSRKERAPKPSNLPRPRLYQEM